MWEAGSIFSTYPWQLHGYHPKTLGFYFYNIKANGTEFWIRSSNCEQEVKGTDACLSCRAVEMSQSLRRLQKRAIEIDKHTNYEYYTFEQLKQLTNEYKDRMNQHRLNVSTFRCSFNGLYPLLTMFYSRL